VLALILIQVRTLPERTGAYLFGMSLLPVIYLGSIAARIPSCSAQPAAGPCYAPITVVALVAYGFAGIAGIGFLAVGLRRLASQARAPRWGR
jgi:hypothetical protein